VTFTGRGGSNPPSDTNYLQERRIPESVSALRAPSFPDVPPRPTDRRSSRASPGSGSRSRPGRRTRGSAGPGGPPAAVATEVRGHLPRLEHISGDCSGSRPQSWSCRGRFGRKTTGWPSPRLLRPRSDAAFGIAFVARVAERLADMPGSVCIRFPGPRKGRAARWSALCPPPRPTGTWPTSSSAWTRAVRLPQHPDEYCAERPVLLAIDQELCEGPAVRVAPELADPVGALEVGEGWA
jgi:hypothetical protein